MNVFKKSNLLGDRKMLNVKKLIETKKDRLFRLVVCQQISKSHANELLKDYAQFVSRYFGCGMQLFNTITATKMLTLIIAACIALC